MQIQILWKNDIADNWIKMWVKMMYTCENLLTVGKNLDRRPWPETRIFIEMDSASRNKQGNCDGVENSARPFFVNFFSIVVEFMQ